MGAWVHRKPWFKILCYFERSDNSGRERQRHAKAARQAELQGPFCVTAAALRRGLT